MSTLTLAKRAKVVEPDPYQGKSIGELRTYKMVCERAFDYEPRSFPNDREKVAWAAMYLREGPATEWARARAGKSDIDLPWEEYIHFLRDLLLEPGNLKRKYALDYENAKQREGQSIRTFASYLEGLSKNLNNIQRVREQPISLPNCVQKYKNDWSRVVILKIRAKPDLH